MLYLSCVHPRSLAHVRSLLHDPWVIRWLMSENTDCVHRPGHMIWARGQCRKCLSWPRIFLPVSFFSFTRKSFPQHLPSPPPSDSLFSHIADLIGPQVFPLLLKSPPKLASSSPSLFQLVHVPEKNLTPFPIPLINQKATLIMIDSYG